MVAIRIKWRKKLVCRYERGSRTAPSYLL